MEKSDDEEDEYQSRRNLGKNEFFFDFYDIDLLTSKRIKKTVLFTSKFECGNCLKVD
jgi:hypothetical protein